MFRLLIKYPFLLAFAGAALAAVSAFYYAKYLGEAECRAAYMEKAATLEKNVRSDNERIDRATPRTDNVPALYNFLLNHAVSDETN